MKFILTAIGLIILITTEASAQAIELRCKIRPEEVSNTKSLIIDLNKKRIQYKYLHRDRIRFDKNDNTIEYSDWIEIDHLTNDFIFWTKDTISNINTVVQTTLFDRETGVLIEAKVVGYQNKSVNDTGRAYNFDMIWDCKRRVL